MSPAASGGIRAKQGKQTKKRISRVAIALFNKHGYHNVTIRDICQKAGVAIGVFYHYYKSKSSILLETVSERDKALHLYGETLEGLSAKEQILRLLRFYARETMDIGVDSMMVLFNPDNVISQEAEGGPRGDTGEIVHILKGIIDAGIQSGEIKREKEDGFTTHFLAIPLRGLLYDWCRNHGNYDLEAAVSEYMEELVPFILTGSNG